MLSLIAWLNECSWHQLSTKAQPCTAPVSVIRHSWPTFSLFLPVQSFLFPFLWAEIFYFVQCPKLWDVNNFRVTLVCSPSISVFLFPFFEPFEVKNFTWEHSRASSWKYPCTKSQYSRVEIWHSPRIPVQQGWPTTCHRPQKNNLEPLERVTKRTTTSSAGPLTSQDICGAARGVLTLALVLQMGHRVISSGHAWGPIEGGSVQYCGSKPHTEPETRPSEFLLGNLWNVAIVFCQYKKQKVKRRKKSFFFHGKYRKKQQKSRSKNTYRTFPTRTLHASRSVVSDTARRLIFAGPIRRDLLADFIIRPHTRRIFSAQMNEMILPSGTKILHHHPRNSTCSSLSSKECFFITIVGRVLVR